MAQVAERLTAIVLHPADNVATLLADRRAGESIRLAPGGHAMTVSLLDDVPFGHKVALRPISPGEDILKYGLSIGQATAGIETGQWVHVHNCGTRRWGARQDKYGIRG